MAITQALSFGSVTLKVTPEVLHTKAETVSTKVSSMSTEFERMNSIVTKSSSYWVGSAGELHRNVYLEKQPDIEDIFKRLQEHVKELHEMAAVYINVENTVKEIAEALPIDVIV